MGQIFGKRSLCCLNKSSWKVSSEQAWAPQRAGAVHGSECTHGLSTLELSLVLNSQYRKNNGHLQFSVQTIFSVMFRHCVFHSGIRALLRVSQPPPLSWRPNFLCSWITAGIFFFYFIVPLFALFDCRCCCCAQPQSEIIVMRRARPVIDFSSNA